MALPSLIMRTVQFFSLVLKGKEANGSLPGDNCLLTRHQASEQLDALQQRYQLTSAEDDGITET